MDECVVAADVAGDVIDATDVLGVSGLCCSLLSSRLASIGFFLILLFPASRGMALEVAAAAAVVVTGTSMLWESLRLCAILTWFWIAAYSAIACFCLRPTSSGARGGSITVLFTDGAGATGGRFGKDS